MKHQANQESLKAFDFRVLVVTFLLVMIPKAELVGVPFPVAGIDFALVWLTISLCIRLVIFREVYWIVDAPINLYAIVFVSIFGISMFSYFVRLPDQGSVFASFLQFTRRVIPILILILFAQQTLRQKHLEALTKILIYGTPLTLLFSWMIMANLIPGLSATHENEGNLFFQVLSIILNIEGTRLSIFLNRWTGNTGNPTSYALVLLLCGFLAYLALKRKWILKRTFFVVCIFYFLIIVATSSKSIIPIAFVCIVLGISAQSRPAFLATLSVIALLGLAIMYFSGNDQEGLTQEYFSRAALSFFSRSEMWAEAFSMLQDQPVLAVLGEGFRSRPTGWHSQIVENFMMTGVFGGVLITGFFYLMLPILLAKSFRTNLNRSLALCALLTILLAALLQDLITEPYTLIYFVSLVSVLRIDEDHQVLPSQLKNI